MRREIEKQEKNKAKIEKKEKKKKKNEDEDADEGRGRGAEGHDLSDSDSVISVNTVDSDSDDEIDDEDEYTSMRNTARERKGVKNPLGGNANDRMIARAIAESNRNMGNLVKAVSAAQAQVPLVLNEADLLKEVNSVDELYERKFYTKEQRDQKMAQLKSKYDSGFSSSLGGGGGDSGDGGDGGAGKKEKKGKKAKK